MQKIGPIPGKPRDNRHSRSHDVRYKPAEKIEKGMILHRLAGETELRNFFEILR